MRWDGMDGLEHLIHLSLQKKVINQQTSLAPPCKARSGGHPRRLEAKGRASVDFMVMNMLINLYHFSWIRCEFHTTYTCTSSSAYIYIYTHMYTHVHVHIHILYICICLFIYMSAQAQYCCRNCISRDSWHSSPLEYQTLCDHDMGVKILVYYGNFNEEKKDTPWYAGGT